MDIKEKHRKGRGGGHYPSLYLTKIAQSEKGLSILDMSSVYAVDLAPFLLFKLRSYCSNSGTNVWILRAIVLDKRGIVFYDVGIAFLMTWEK